MVQTSQHPVMDARRGLRCQRAALCTMHIYYVILHIYILARWIKRGLLSLRNNCEFARRCADVSSHRSLAFAHTQIIIVSARHKKMYNDKLKKDTRFWLSERASARCWWPLSLSLLRLWPSKENFAICVCVQLGYLHLSRGGCLMYIAQKYCIRVEDRWGFCIKKRPLCVLNCIDVCFRRSGDFSSCHAWCLHIWAFKNS